MAGQDFRPEISEESLNDIFLDPDSEVEPWDSALDAEGSKSDEESDECESRALRYFCHCLSRGIGSSSPRAQQIATNEDEAAEQERAYKPSLMSLR